MEDPYFWIFSINSCSRFFFSPLHTPCSRTSFPQDHGNVASVVRDVRKELGVIVSDWTVCRALSRAGLSSKVKQKKPKLTPKPIEDCLDFAKRHQNWTLSN
jgi:transposase